MSRIHYVVGSKAITHFLTHQGRLIALLIAECNTSAEFMVALRTGILECYESMGDKEPRKPGFLPELLRSGE